MNDVNISNLHWSTNHFVQSSNSDDHTRLFSMVKTFMSLTMHENNFRIGS